MTVSSNPVVNIAVYKFVTLSDLERRQAEFLSICERLSLRGKIILSEEGINLFLAGSREAIDEFLAELRSKPEFTDVEVKESFNDFQPFKRMLVKVKKEIIAFGVPGIDPRKETSKRISAKELKKRLDDGEPVVMLDVRNNFEFDLGTFDDAIPIGVRHFRSFAEAISTLPDDIKDRPIVTFCTGGIRCEKAGPLLERFGFSDVYQLDGGILKYFEEVGGDHYHGDCFVFDQRITLNAKLEEQGGEDIWV